LTLITRWVTLRARWVTLRARWVTLRARWVDAYNSLGDVQVRQGARCSLLIHEATFEPNLHAHALQKRHSTTAEVRVGHGSRREREREREFPSPHPATVGESRSRPSHAPMHARVLPRPPFRAVPHPPGDTRRDARVAEAVGRCCNARDGAGAGRGQSHARGVHRAHALQPALPARRGGARGGRRRRRGGGR
jgi:hypothetical protein